jgi:hypothetical protein
MKVTGFSFIRNAIRYDYPIVEAITSILPICDAFVVAVGKSADETLALIRAIDSPKISIIETEWDDSLREGGKVLAIETNKAFAAIAADTDWCFYIQGDEVVHEQYLPAIRAAMETHLHAPDVDGLLFHYLHFYGSYDYVGDSRKWYRHEIRVIKNNRNITSYRDAQGFRMRNGGKLRVKAIDAYMYHYGWVKDPFIRNLQQENHKYWHNDEWIAKHVKIAPDVAFDYSRIDSLARFTGSHPAVMHARIARMNWQFSFDIRRKNFPLKNRILHTIEQLTGWRIGEYKNYIRV